MGLYTSPYMWDLDDVAGPEVGTGLYVAVEDFFLKYIFWDMVFFRKGTLVVPITFMFYPLELGPSVPTLC